MRKIFYTLLTVSLGTGAAMAQPANDNCANATSISVDGGLTCGTTLNATLQGSECFTNYGGGASEHTTWYRVNATDDSLVFAFNQTNVTNCVSPHVRIYGPFTPGGGCLPACGGEVYNEHHNGDPGQHTLLTGLSVGSDYLIQVQDLDCGGPNDGHTEYCLGMFTPQPNTSPGGAAGIDECGITYNGTNIGYSYSTSGPGNENLDGNAGTTCAGCTAGEEVTYVVNNDSWFNFCATTAGDWEVVFDGISNCQNAAPNNGLQMTIFIGTPTNLGTVVWNASSPSSPGSSQTSPTFSVAAGECVYMVVDGFAGDQCDYQYTLNNVSGGCNLLPLPAQLSLFFGYNENGSNILKWKTVSEINTSHFKVERSSDGVNWRHLDDVAASGNSNSSISYAYLDKNYDPTMNYYRLAQYDNDGSLVWIDRVTINNTPTESELVKTVNSLGQEVSSDTKGVIYDVYSDGTTKMRVND
ncbi:MAG: hypothetical protein NXI10_14225 [bacterium]|nr:hypothetical protein [bacterium]